MYNVTNRNSFELIRSIYKDIQRLNPLPVIVLIGTNCDIDDPGIELQHELSVEEQQQSQQIQEKQQQKQQDHRQVSYEEGENLAKELNFSFFMECSSKTGVNVDIIVTKTLEILTNKYTIEPLSTFPLHYTPEKKPCYYHCFCCCYYSCYYCCRICTIS